MAKQTITTFITLDGVMQAAGGPKEDPSGSFVHGGWMVPFADADFGNFMVEVFSKADAFLLGRKTYEISPSTRSSSAGDRQRRLRCGRLHGIGGGSGISSAAPR